MNLVDLVFEEMALSIKRERANKKRQATKAAKANRVCRECGHQEIAHVWDRDGVPCTNQTCRCPSYWDGTE